MKSLYIFLSLFFCCFIATAQNDSIYYDLGRVKLRKDFTQAVTIKASELEKIPFSDLSEAIEIWFFGELFGTSNLVYVVDGNLINDVNIYPIHHIEEITLIQNAVIQFNGALRNEHLVVITTNKQEPNNQGLKLSSQAAIVSKQIKQGPFGKEEESETNLFQQYTLSAYRKTTKLDYNISANFVRDVNPYVKNEFVTVHQPHNSRQLRLNGYLNFDVGQNTHVSIQSNYVPQTINYKLDIVEKKSYDHQNLWSLQGETTSRLFSNSIQIKSRILKKLNNHFSVSSNHFEDKKEKHFNRNANTSFYHFYSYNESNLKGKAYLFKDEISYVQKFRNWNFEPALNLSYRYIESNFNENTRDFFDQLLSSWSGIKGGTSTKISTITPSLNINYKTIFNVHGGFIVDFVEEIGENNDKHKYPFVTFASDMSKAIDEDIKPSWKIYGSFCQSKDLSDQIYQFQSVNNEFFDWENIGVGHSPDLSSRSLHDYSINSYQFGSTIGVFRNMLEISYNYDVRDWKMYLPRKINPSLGVDVPGFFEAKEKLKKHRIGLSSKLLERTTIDWRSSLHYTIILEDGIINQPKIEGTAWFKTFQLSASRTGSYAIENIKNPSYISWINRVSFENLSLGLDIQGQFQQQYLTLENESARVPVSETFNTLTLQNIYFGYQNTRKKGNVVEFYLYGRNFVLNDPIIKTNNRRYFGMGINVSI